MHQYMKATGRQRFDRWIVRTSAQSKVLRLEPEGNCKGGEHRMDPRMLELGASAWTVRLMRLTDP